MKRILLALLGAFLLCGYARAEDAPIMGAAKDTIIGAPSGGGGPLTVGGLAGWHRIVPATDSVVAYSGGNGAGMRYEGGKLSWTAVRGVRVLFQCLYTNPTKVLNYAPQFLVRVYQGYNVLKFHVGVSAPLNEWMRCDSLDYYPLAQPDTTFVRILITGRNPQRMATAPNN